MHRVMQHRISRMFLSEHGTLSPYVWEASQFRDLAEAVSACRRHNLAPSDFAFRIFEQEPGEELQALPAA